MASDRIVNASFSSGNWLNPVSLLGRAEKLYETTQHWPARLRMALVTSLTELGYALLDTSIESNGSILGPDLDRVESKHHLTQPQPTCRPFLVPCEQWSAIPIVNHRKSEFLRLPFCIARAILVIKLNPHDCNFESSISIIIQEPKVSACLIERLFKKKANF